MYRKATTVETPWGPVAGKLGWLDGRPPVFTPEHDACARVARERQKLPRDVPVLIYHVKPQFADETATELMQLGGDITVVEQDKTYSI